MRPFEDLQSTGLLWLINVSVFHPRGYAIAIHFNDMGNAEGWSLIGDGSEAWYMVEPSDEQKALGARSLDDLMLSAKAMLP